MMPFELFTALELEFFEYMLLLALLYCVLVEAKLCWMEFRAFVHSVYRRIFGGPRKYRRRLRVTFDNRVYIRSFEPCSEELEERMEFWREVKARSETIMDVDDEDDDDDREDDPEEISLVEEGEDLLGDDDGEGEGAPESEEDETDACFREVEAEDGDDPTEQVEVGDYSSDPPLVVEEPLGLDRSSMNGWRSVRLARKPQVSYLGMC